ncbi:hypothetical protein ACWD6I_06255 [Streptomyces sp. NPDC002454]
MDDDEARHVFADARRKEAEEVRRLLVTEAAAAGVHVRATVQSEPGGNRCWINPGWLSLTEAETVARALSVYRESLRTT